MYRATLASFLLIMGAVTAAHAAESVQAKFDYFVAKNDWDSVVKMGESAVPPLIDLLKDPSVEMRNSAASALELIGDKRAVPALLAAIRKQDDAPTMARALFRMGYVPDVADKEFRLSENLPDDITSTHPDIETCVLLLAKDYLAERLLVRLGEPAVETLCQLLSYSKEKRHFVTGERVARALGQIGDKRAVEVLIAVADGKDLNPSGYVNVAPEQPMTAAAAEALGDLGDKRATRQLIALLESPKTMPDVWTACAQSLGALGDRQAVGALGALLRQHRTRWQYESPYEQAACRTLVQFGSESIEPLSLVLGDKAIDDEIREQAGLALGAIGDMRTAPVLREGLTDQSERVRIAATSSLSVLRDQEAAIPLIDMLRSSEKRNAAEIIEIVKALAALRDTRAVDPLIGLLRHADYFVRYWAAASLDSLGWKP